MSNNRHIYNKEVWEWVNKDGIMYALDSGCGTDDIIDPFVKRAAKRFLKAAEDFHKALEAGLKKNGYLICEECGELTRSKKGDCGSCRQIRKHLRDRAKRKARR